MRPRFPKKYGEYKTDWCPYCGKKALSRNTLGLNVCKDHKETKEGPVFRTPKGDFIEIRPGKYGNYGQTMDGRNFSLKQIFEMNGKSLED